MKLKWLAVLVAAILVVPAESQFRPAHRFALSADYLAKAVESALLLQGIEIDVGQVSFLGEVIASEPYPVLHVNSMRVLRGSFSGNSQARSTVKLMCHSPGECLPFYAIVTWPAEISAPGVGLFHSPSTPVPTKMTEVPAVMRAGTHATLLMEDGRARIEIPVISLESGPAGRTIRAQSPDRKMTYSAEIIGANMLKGSF